MSGGLRQVTVLYDARCNLCRAARSWLERQDQLVPLEFLSAGSPEAERRYPFLVTGADAACAGGGVVRLAPPAVARHLR